MCAALIAACATLLVACGGGGGGGGGGGKATAPPATDATAGGTTAPVPATAVPATATPDAIGKAEVDGALIFQHTQRLAAEIGPRVAGTPGEIQARDWIKSTLESYGYDVTLQEFGFDASAFLPVRVDVAGGAADGIPGIAMRGSASGVASGRLYDSGGGRPGDFPVGGLHGGIALMQRSDLPFADKVRNAIAAGASGAIIYNNVPGSLVGNLGGSVPIEVAGIRQVAGEGLVARVAAGPVDAKVTVSAPTGTAYNVIARPKGATTCTTIVGGHYDSVAVTGGADDNASGAAAVIEFARVAAAKHLAGANCYVLFSAEELGLFGSGAFVEKRTPEEIQSLRAMINLDVTGVAAPLELIGDAGLTDVARLQAGKLHIEASAASLPPGTASDHVSFEKAGVPVVMLSRQDNLIHTAQDAMDRIVPSSLADTVSLAMATLAAITGG